MISREKVISREKLKADIDTIQEEYLGALQEVLQALQKLPKQNGAAQDAPSFQDQEWQAFVSATYGILADDPIERGDQGWYEDREEIH